MAELLRTERRNGNELDAQQAGAALVIRRRRRSPTAAGGGAHEEHRLGHRGRRDEGNNRIKSVRLVNSNLNAGAFADRLHVKPRERVHLPRRALRLHAAVDPAVLLAARSLFVLHQR